MRISRKLHIPQPQAEADANKSQSINKRADTKADQSKQALKRRLKTCQSRQTKSICCTVLAD